MANTASLAVTVEFPLRVVVYPAIDLPGQWIAHGLETDVVTQGNSPEHALAMMGDALLSLTTYQALRRRPNLRLRPAPREVWDLAETALPLDITATMARGPSCPMSMSVGSAEPSRSTTSAFAD